MTADGRDREGSIRVGVDIGGTFTDLLALDEANGAVYALKTSSTADAPDEAIVNGLVAMRSRFGVEPSRIDYFSHGTTLAVNTLLQRNGAAVGVLTTRGFRDTLELRRLRLPKSNDYFVPKPRSLVPRRHVHEIDERLLSDGSVLIAIDKAQVEEAARALHAEGIRSIAVCFLHSFRNEMHERSAKGWIEALYPDVYVCTSSEIWPQQREYERFLISVINGHVGARMTRYFAALSERLVGLGLNARAFSTKSNGGVMSLEAAAARPVETLLSGPASGVIGAAYVGKLIGEKRLITLDMGGTSTDISVVDGEVSYSSDNTIGDFPVIMPAVDVSAIGAGGGSIAWINPEGVLKVGPHSAGAVPGPVCYGRGGVDPTVTDAYVTAGLCSPHNFLGGEMRVDGEAAASTIRTLANRMGLNAFETADAILRITTANIYAGLVPQIARRGVDVSDCALFLYGAAGPTHGFMVAREMGFGKVIVPPTPGLLCALGCLVADLRADFVRTVTHPLDAMDDEALRALYGDLARQARAWMEREAVVLDQVFTICSADMSYAGQSFELNVLLDGDPDSIRRSMLARAFHERHRIAYGHAEETAPIQLVDVRVQIVGIMPKPEVRLAASQRPPDKPAHTRRPIFENGRELIADVWNRLSLSPFDIVTGPCVVEQYDTNIYAPEGFRLTVDERLNIIGTPQ
jgi:N-methylhydantoinase A